MKQSKQKKSFKVPKITPKPTLVLLTILLIAQLIFNVYIYQRTTDSAGDGVITNLVIGAVRALHKPAPIDALTGKVYFNEARLVLPAPSDSHMQILYSSAGSGAGTELQVTTSHIMSWAESKLWAAQNSRSSDRERGPAFFDQVPNLQACARGVQMYFSTPRDLPSETKLVAQKTLHDGRELYFYTETICTYDQTALVQYLKQVDSY